MEAIRSKLLKSMVVLTTGILPGSGFECDLDDGELEIEFDGFGGRHGHRHHHDDGFSFDIFIEEDYEEGV